MTLKRDFVQEMEWVTLVHISKAKASHMAKYDLGGAGNYNCWIRRGGGYFEQW